MMAQLEQVTVGIVGAGIGGLTLAKMLEMLGISYVLWEARSGIDEAAGAGVGLMPNGLRILDQLRVFEEVQKYDLPHHSWEYRDADGTIYQTLTAMKALKTEYDYFLPSTTLGC
jgi:FAD dependent monooxygenase